MPESSGTEKSARRYKLGATAPVPESFTRTQVSDTRVRWDWDLTPAERMAVLEGALVEIWVVLKDPTDPRPAIQVCVGKNRDLGPIQ